jgi:hypothetical protein
VAGRLDNHGTVRGDVVHIPLPFLPRSFKAPLGMLGAHFAWFAFLWITLSFLIQLLLAALAPARVLRLSEEVPVRLFWAYLAGIGGYAALWLVNGLLFLTVLGAPLALFGVYPAFLVLKWFGLAGIYHRIGSGAARLAGRELSLLPAVLLGFLPFALIQLLPFVIGGWLLFFGIALRVLFWMLVEVPAVGLVLLTRVGSPGATLAVPPAAVEPALPAAPLAPPPTPSAP